MEENKVVIPLKDYLELYDGQKEKNLDFQVLLELVFQNTELTSDKNGLRFEYYNSKLMTYLKDKYPEKYKKQVELLKEMED